MQYLKQIFKLQHELNVIIQKDTINAAKELRDSWLFGYAFALQQELGELYDCLVHSPNYELRIFNLGNAKLETIDAIHFMVSVFHILDITSDDVFNNFFKNYQNIEHQVSDQMIRMFSFEQHAQQRRDSLNINRAEQLNQAVLEAWRKTDELLNTTSWKWWSADVKSAPDTQFKQIYFPEKAEQAAFDIFRIIIRMCCILDMSVEDVVSVYKQKHAANIKRQENDYDVRTKTEHDNLDIEKKLDNIMQSCSDKIVNDLNNSSDDKIKMMGPIRTDWSV